MLQGRKKGQQSVHCYIVSYYFFFFFLFFLIIKMIEAAAKLTAHGSQVLSYISIKCMSMVPICTSNTFIMGCTSMLSFGSTIQI
jgi:hypothetical protein